MLCSMTQILKDTVNVERLPHYFNQAMAWYNWDTWQYAPIDKVKWSWACLLLSWFRCAPIFRRTRFAPAFFYWKLYLLYNNNKQVIHIYTNNYRWHQCYGLWIDGIMTISHANTIYWFQYLTYLLIIILLLLTCILTYFIFSCILVFLALLIFLQLDAHMCRSPAGVWHYWKIDR